MGVCGAGEGGGGCVGLGAVGGVVVVVVVLVLGAVGGAVVVVVRRAGRRGGNVGGCALGVVRLKVGIVVFFEMIVVGWGVVVMAVGGEGSRCLLFGTGLRGYLEGSQKR